MFALRDLVERVRRSEGDAQEQRAEHLAHALRSLAKYHAEVSVCVRESECVCERERERET